MENAHPAGVSAVGYLALISALVGPKVPFCAATFTRIKTAYAICDTGARDGGVTSCP